MSLADIPKKSIPDLILEETAKRPEGWWWVLFYDYQKGYDGFIGSCIVRGHGVATANQAIHALGCHPGGEAHATEYTKEPPEWARNKLLTSEELHQIFGALDGLIP